MASLNSVVLIGNLTRDPELRYTQAGKAMAKFSIALNRYWKDHEGNKQEETTFVNIVAWGPQAENCTNYLKKGRPVAVEGRLSIRSYTTEEGEKRKTTEVVANNVQFLGSAQESYGEKNYGDKTSETPTEDEVPF